MPSRLAVVIPAYRAAATIERAVRSVMGQPHVRAQIVVVVDDREGATEGVLSHMKGNELRVLTNTVNMGAQKSRNRGLAAVDAEYVMFLDSDDFVMGDLLVGLADALAKGSDIAFGPWLRYDEAANRVERHLEEYVNASDLLERWLVHRRWTPPCAVLWRTQFLRGIGGWDETLSRNQDGEVVCRGALAGARLGFSDRGCGVYVQHDSPDRITSVRSTFGDLIKIAEGLLAQTTQAIPEPDRRRIIGDYFFWLADSAFRRDDPKQGRHAMNRAAQLGGSDRSASPLQRLGSKVLGLERYRRLACWMRRDQSA